MRPEVLSVIRREQRRHGGCAGLDRVRGGAAGDADGPGPRRGQDIGAAARIGLAVMQQRAVREHEDIRIGQGLGVVVESDLGSADDVLRVLERGHIGRELRQLGRVRCSLGRAAHDHPVQAQFAEVVLGVGARALAIALQHPVVRGRAEPVVVLGRAGPDSRQPQLVVVGGHEGVRVEGVDGDGDAAGGVVAEAHHALVGDVEAPGEGLDVLEAGARGVVRVEDAVADLQELAADGLLEVADLDRDLAGVHRGGAPEDPGLDVAAVDQVALRGDGLAGVGRRDGAVRAAGRVLPAAGVGVRGGRVERAVGEGAELGAAVHVALVRSGWRGRRRRARETWCRQAPRRV